MKGQRIVPRLPILAIITAMLLIGCNGRSRNSVIPDIQSESIANRQAMFFSSTLTVFGSEEISAADVDLDTFRLHGKIRIAEH